MIDAIDADQFSHHHHQLNVISEEKLQQSCHYQFRKQSQQHDNLQSQSFHIKCIIKCVMRMFTLRHGQRSNRFKFCTLRSKWTECLFVFNFIFINKLVHWWLRWCCAAHNWHFIFWTCFLLLLEHFWCFQKLNKENEKERSNNQKCHQIQSKSPVLLNTMKQIANDFYIWLLVLWFINYIACYRIGSWKHFFFFY